MHTKIAVLGISLGTKKIGIAVLYNTEPIVWGVTLFPGEWSKQKCSTILRKIEYHVEKYHIQRIALKIPSLTQVSHGISQLLSAIKAFIKANCLTLHCYTIEEIKAYCLPDYPCTKKAIIEYIANRYPELHYDAKRECNNRNPHHIKAFEAVIAARLCV